jgi:hypothetical protein
METIPSLSQDERYTSGPTRLDLQHEMQGAARVKTRTRSSRQLIAE